MVDDDRAGRLLRRELGLLAQLDADPLPLQQVLDLVLVLDGGAGRVAERVARAAVLLLGQHRLQVALLGEAKLLADAVVPVLREGLGELHRQAVQLEVLAVVVAGEHLRGDFGHVRAHRDDGEADDIDVAAVLAAEEVRQAQPSVPALPREGEAAPLVARLRVQDDEVLVLADGREVSVHDGGVHDALGLDLGHQLAQARPALLLDELVV
jgi:hypothetical protein